MGSFSFNWIAHLNGKYFYIKKIAVKVYFLILHKEKGWFLKM